jgi:hypothetical protein
VQEVAATSREQSTSVAQMSQAMNQVDSVTQRNASAAEELASTAEEMASQAEVMRDLIGFFSVVGMDRAERFTQPIAARFDQPAHAPTFATHAPRRDGRPIAPPPDFSLVHRSAYAPTKAAHPSNGDVGHGHPAAARRQAPDAPLPDDDDFERF